MHNFRKEIFLRKSHLTAQNRSLSSCFSPAVERKHSPVSSRMKPAQCVSASCWLSHRPKKNSEGDIKWGWRHMTEKLCKQATHKGTPLQAHALKDTDAYTVALVCPLFSSAAGRCGASCQTGCPVPCLGFCSVFCSTLWGAWGMQRGVAAWCQFTLKQWRLAETLTSTLYRRCCFGFSDGAKPFRPLKPLLHWKKAVKPRRMWHILFVSGFSVSILITNSSSGRNTNTKFSRNIVCCSKFAWELLVVWIKSL